MRRYVLVVFSLGCLVSCASFNGYFRFYKAYVDPHTLQEVALLSEDQEPQIYTSSNLDNDVIDVLSNHYILVGVSSFNGPTESFDGIKAVCQQNGATLVLVSTDYTDTRNVQGTISLPTTVTSSTSGSVRVGGSYGTYRGTTTSRGTTYIPYSYNVDRYEQTALYFVKMTKKLKIGLNFDNLNENLRRQNGRNQGVVITIVYKGTPAFSSNLMNGDIVVAANGKEVIDGEDFGNTLNALPLTGTLQLHVLRDMKDIEITITY